MNVAALLRTLALLLLALCLPAAEPSRAEAVRVEVDMMCPILSVKAEASGTLLLEIARGTRHGLVKGARGDVYEAQAKSGIGQVIARAELITVGPEVSIARTTPGTVLDPAKVTARAQLEVRALLPKNVHRGQLFELYTKGIEFLDNMRQPIVDPMLLLTDTTGEVEKRALANMVTAGREVVEFTLDMAQVQTRTRWKGKLVHEILTNNDERDYREFLRFVADYPGKYIGQAWKISETYATWLINFSPPAAIDRYEELRDAKPADFAALVKAMSEADLTWAIKWIRQQISNHPKSKLAESLAMQKVADRIIKARGGLAKQPPNIRAEWLHIMARVQDDVPGKALDAARLYKETSAAYLAVGDEESILEAVIARNNHLGQLNVLGRDDEVLAELAVIQALIREHLPRVKNPMYAIHLESADDFPAKIVAGIYKKQGRYRDIIALLTPMVDRIAKVGARGARAEEMEMRELIAAAHDRLGEVERADELYKGIVHLAAELGDAERQASALFAIGDMYHASGRYERSAERFRESAELGQRAGLSKAQAKGLAAEGQALWNMGKLADALARHRQAMALREAIGDESGIAWQSVQVAKIQLQSGDREAARQAFERALALYQKLADKGSEADTRLELGDLYMTLKQHAQALGEFGQARELLKALGQRVREASAIQKMASATMTAGDHVGADKLITQAIAVLEKTGDKRELANARLWLGRVRHNAGDPKSARQLIEGVMPRDPSLDPSTAIDALTELVSLEVSYGTPDKALALAQQAMALAEKNQDAWRMNSALHALRNAYGALGDLAKQEEVMVKALALSEQSGNKPFTVSALQQLAWVYSDTGRLAEAKAHAERAVALARENDDPFEVAWSLNTLSKVLQGYNDVKTELLALEEAHRLVSQVNYRYGLAAITFNRALTYARLRDLQRALDGYREAEQALTGTPDTQFEVALPSARGEALMLLGRHDEAEKSLTLALGKARAKNPARVPTLLVHLARLESSRGRHEAAIAWAEEAVSVEEQRTTASSGARAMLGRVLAAAGRHDEARAALDIAVTRARKAGGAVSWELLHQLALAESRRGEKKAAIALLKEAATEIEKGESVLGEDSGARFHADKVQVFRLLVKLLLADNQIDGALGYLERGKMAELRELQGRMTGGDENAALAIELDVQEKKLQRLLDDELMKATPNQSRIGQLDTLLIAAKKRRSEFMEKLDRNDQLFDRYAVRPLQLEKLQQYLGDGVLVVAPVILDDSIVVFAMSKDALTHYSTPMGPQEIDALVTGFVREVDPKNAVGVRAKASLNKLLPQARRLYDLLLRPAFTAFPGVTTLVVSPTGALRYLPFSALHDGERWLIEKVSVVSVTALDREKFAKPAPRGGANLSAMALAPDGRLTASRAELAEVRRALGNVDVFEGKDASSATLRQKIRVPGYDIVHLATHGRLDAKNPELSNIELADRALSYGDIPTLSPTRTNLVVLSACQTAVLSGGSGLEIAGLAYQFQRGQVHSVMATLWEVDDRATADLMGGFYDQVRAGKTYAEALAESQRKMIADPTLGHPGFWASFILMGTP